MIGNLFLSPPHPIYKMVATSHGTVGIQNHFVFGIKVKGGAIRHAKDGDTLTVWLVGVNFITNARCTVKIIDGGADLVGLLKMRFHIPTRHLHQRQGILKGIPLEEIFHLQHTRFQFMPARERCCQ